MKRRISLLLAVVMILGSFSFVFAAEETAEEAAGAFLKEVGVLEGINGDLKLEDNLRRQDMVVLIARLHGAEEEAEKFPTEDLKFTDFKDPYYRPIIAWAVANELIEGHTPERFGFNENVTAQQYATVLLRALGYNDKVANKEGYAKALEEAKALGILENVEVENDTVVTRGQMAVMTFNALGVKVKDSDKTLAEKLGIEMPEPEKLEVEEVKAENLKEIKVVFNKAVDAESATNLDNYETNAGDIKDINYIESENVARILLDGKMKNKEDYKLTINGVKDDKNTLELTKEFTAVDNAIPEVVEVVGLGTKAVKVVMSEPVDSPNVKNFKLDGKAAYGTLNVAAGRDIILKTHTTMSVGEHTLTVTGLKDYAGFKSVESDHKFEVVEDKENPTVVDVKATLNRVVLTFSEDVDNISANKVYWKSGSTKIYADKVNRLAGNKFEILFNGEKGLPAHETTLYVEGVVDYSGNKLENPEVKVTPTIDTTRPVVRSATVKQQGKVIEVKFSKAVNTEKGEKASALNIDRYTVLDKKDNKVTISEITNKKGDAKTFEIVLGKALDAEETYTLKIEGIKDTNRYPNYMVDYSEKISAGDFDVPKLEDVAIKVKTDGDDKIHTITLFFNRAMDIGTVSNPENYLLEVDGSNVLLSKLDYDIEIKDSDARKIVLTVVTEKKDNVNITAVAGLGLKGTNGKELSNYGKMVKPDTAAFEIKSVVAKAKDKVEVTFSKAVEVAPEKAFTIGGTVVADATIKGDVVVLEPKSKLDSDAYKYKLVVDAEEIKNYLDDELKGKVEWDLEDEIAPKIDSAVATTEGTDIVITVKFDEPLADLESNWETDLTVKRIEGDKKLNYELAKGEADELKITIAASEVGVNKTAFYVGIDETARFIVDMKGNKAAKSNARTGAIDNIDELVEKVDEDAAKAVTDKIKALPETIKLENAEAVKEAEKAYNALTAEQKKLIKAEDKAKLDAAVAKIVELEADKVLEDELDKYVDVEIDKAVEVGTEISLLQENVEANKDIKVSYEIKKGADYLEIKDGKLVLKNKLADDVTEDYPAEVTLTLSLNGQTKIKNVTVTLKAE